MTPQAIDEPEVGLIPQMQAQPVAPLFGDRRIFVSALQYHWHVQGVVGTEDKARQHIVALAQRLHEFGHQTEAREMQLWHRLGHAAQLFQVEQRVVHGQ